MRDDVQHLFLFEHFAQLAFKFTLIKSAAILKICSGISPRGGKNIEHANHTNIGSAGLASRITVARR